MILFILLVTIPSIIFGQSISVVPRLDEPIYTDDGDIVTFPRIIGGTQAQPGEIPGIVSVQTNSYRHFCGGTWIHATHIVTAAHCLTDESGRVYSPSVLAVMGDDTNISAANSSRQVKSVSHVFVHPQYNIDTIANDIAILRLTTAFVSTTRFQQMPRFSSIPPANTACVVAGWGVTAENNVQTNPYLLRVDVQIIDMITCNGSTSYQGLIPPSAFCAGVMVGGKDACQGDSGGPLICGNQLAGIVSFGYGCAKPRYPGVYTDVSKFSDWISNTIGHSGNNTSVPTPTTIKPGSNQASAIIVSLSLLLISLLIITT